MLHYAAAVVLKVDLVQHLILLQTFPFFLLNSSFFGLKFQLSWDGKEKKKLLMASLCCWKQKRVKILPFHALKLTSKNNNKLQAKHTIRCVSRITSSFVIL